MRGKSKDSTGIPLCLAKGKPVAELETIPQ